MEIRANEHEANCPDKKAGYVGCRRNIQGCIADGYVNESNTSACKRGNCGTCHNLILEFAD